MAGRWLSRPALAAALAMLLAGCSAFGDLLGGTRVEAVAHSVQKPANVAAYLEITDGDEPVADLEPQHFRVYEDDQLLSPDAIGLTLLPRELVTHERVVLLLDLGAKPSAETVASYEKGVQNFVSGVQRSLPVTVLAYDGAPGLKLVGDYPRAGEGAAAPNTAAVKNLRPGDDSRDLHGAIVKGIRELDVRLMTQKKPIRLGTVVVVARGPDLAGRTGYEQVLQALEHRHYDIVGIGVGEDTPYLDNLTTAGVVRAQAEDTLPIALEEAASKVVGLHRKYYLLAYCSPARAGTRALRIEVEYMNREGDQRSGSYYFEFDATGFGPGCKPETTPRFVVPRPPNEAAPAASGSTPVDPSQATQDDSTPPADTVAPPPDKPEYQ